MGVSDASDVVLDEAGFDGVGRRPGFHLNGDVAGEVFLTVHQNPPERKIPIGIFQGIRVEPDPKRDGFVGMQLGHGDQRNVPGGRVQQIPLVCAYPQADNFAMGEWTTQLVAGELVFLVGAAVFFYAGVRAAWRARRAKGSPWRKAAPFFLACLTLVFVRHWAMGQEAFRAPTAALQKQVEKVPEVVQNLQKVNDWVFHYGILLGIPVAFLLGFLFHMFTGFAWRMVVRVPLALVACAGLFIVHQMVTKKADGVGEAFGHLWTSLSGVFNRK